MIQIVSFKEYRKNSLQGFATIRLTNIGLEIRDCVLHEKDGKRWLAMPSKPIQKDNKTAWVNILDFYDKGRKDQLQAATLAALDAFLAKGKGGADGF